MSAEKKVLTGKVVKKSGLNTISVLVQDLKRHGLYQKVFSSSKKYLVDDPKNEAQLGDNVEIVATRPISKLKFWRLRKIVPASEG
ncbi:MAG: 30S ribosomal protein S17 [Candidatus Margulisiibacteriota bacterium]